MSFLSSLKGELIVLEGESVGETEMSSECMWEDVTKEDKVVIS
jgi:hypothetical protein